MNQLPQSGKTECFTQCSLASSTQVLVNYSVGVSFVKIYFEIVLDGQENLMHIAMIYLLKL
jgi:hypothetical protein